MSSLHVIARFNWRRAFFFISLISLLLTAACTSRSMELRSASLYPLFVYDPAFQEPTVFAALQVSLEQGDTILKQVSLHSETDMLSWRADLAPADAVFTRTPPENSTEEPADTGSPFFASSGDQSRTDFLYPWFASAGSRGLGTGIYKVTLEDFSGNRRTLNAQLNMPSEERTDALEARLSSMAMRPESFPRNSYFQILQVSETGEIQRYDSVSFIREVLSRPAASGPGENSAATPQFYFWGAFTDIDILFLAGPFFLDT